MNKEAYQAGVEQALADSGIVADSMEKQAINWRGAGEALNTARKALGPAGGAGVGAGLGGLVGGVAGGDVESALLGAGAGGLGGALAGGGAGQLAQLLSKNPRAAGLLERMAPGQVQAGNSEELLRKILLGAGGAGAAGMGIGALA